MRTDWVTLLGLMVFACNEPSNALNEIEYAGLRAVGEPAQSPSGRWVAYRVRFIDLKANRLIEEIRVQAAHGGKARTLGEGRTPQWSFDEQSLSYCRGHYPCEQIVIAEIATGRERVLSIPERSFGSVHWMKRRASLGTLATLANGRGTHLVLVDSQARIVSDLPGFDGARDYDFSPDDQRISVVLPQSIELRALDSTDKREIANGPAKRSAALFSPTGEQLLYFENEGSPGTPMRPVVFDLATGMATRLGQTFPYWLLGYPPQYVEWGLDGQTVLFGVPQQQAFRLYRLDIRANGTSAISPPGIAPFWITLDQAQKSMMFSLSTSDTAPEVFATGMDEFAPRMVTHENPQRYGFATATPVTWQSSDGQPIEGLFMRPYKASSGRVPLVVLMEGTFGTFDLTFSGREVADNGGLFPVSQQLFAEEGWAVLMPNVRGSWGYGIPFARLINGNFGIGPTNDILTGIDSLVRQGQIDPDRVAIVGIWLDGYRAALASARDPHIRAVIVLNSMLDLSAWYPVDSWLGPERLKAMTGGDPWNNPQLFASLSPFANLNRVKAGTLCIATEPEPTWLAVQAEQYCSGLQTLGIDSKYQGPTPGGLEAAPPSQYLELQHTMNEWIHRQFERGKPQDDEVVSPPVGN